MIVLSIVSVVCTHFLVMPIIHIYWQRLRPFVVLGTPHLFTVETYGFPSGHTMLSFTIATIAYFFNRRVGLGLYILRICIGMTRISGGVHYPLDVIGGAIIGTIVAVGVIYGYRFLFLLKRV
jgi:undecaprenyl-diphosphatase